MTRRIFIALLTMMFAPASAMRMRGSGSGGGGGNNVIDDTAAFVIDDTGAQVTSL